MALFRSKQPKKAPAEKLKKQDEDPAFITSVSKLVIPNDMIEFEEDGQQKSAKQASKEARPDHPLLKVLPTEPDDVGRQRGWIPQDDQALLRKQVQTADILRKKVLAPNLSLDLPLERTEELEDKALDAIARLIDKGHISLPESESEQEAFFESILNETFGYGPLEAFVESDTVSEIMVNGPYIVFVEIDGRVHETGHKFLDDDHVERIIKRIALPLGRMADSENPLVDARLPDGSRFNAVMRPVAIDGPSISIRKFAKNRLSTKDLLNFGSLNKEMAYFLEAIVVGRQNIVVSGGTGSGKTTLINCLSGYIPEHERTVTIEDAAELQFWQRNVVRLETKKPTPNTPREVSIRDCVKNALRMRPERIVVGECRGGETLDMLQAMNTGHDGSMTTVHANDPRSCLSRLETLVLMSGEELPINIVRKQIAGSVNFIVQASRLRDGSRKITHITEVAGMEGDTVVLNDIFKFYDEGDQNGKVAGQHASVGLRPNCEPILKQYGYSLPAAMFIKPRKK